MSPSSTSSSEFDDLVPALPDVDRTGWRRVGAPLIVLLFLVTLAGSGVWDLVRPARGPQLTDKDQADRDRERAAARVADGSFMRTLDRDLQEHSNLRETLVPWYIARCLLPLHEGGAGVVVGDGGWLYLLDRIRPRGGTHRPTHGPVAANVLTAIERRLATLGIETVLLPLPRKSTIATPFLPSGVDPEVGYEESLLAILAARRIPYVDLFEVWRGMDPTALWQRQDTHWSLLGMWHALDAATRVLGVWTPPEERASDVALDQEIPVKRMLLVTLGIPKDHPAMASLVHESLPAPQVKRQSLKNLPEDGPDVVLVGTSFSATPAATRQLSHLVNRSASNLARGGTIVGITLEESLKSGELDAGDRLILEVPSFQLQGLGFGKQGPELLNSNMIQPLSYVHPPGWSELDPSLDLGKAGRGELSAGQLATSGDGIVSIQFVGAPEKAGRIRATLIGGGTRLTQRWRDGDPSLLLPILSHRPDSQSLSVHLQGARPGHDIRARLVTELDLEHPIDLPPTSVEADTGGWSEVRPLPASGIGSRHAALWIRLAPKGKGPRGELRVELLGPEGAAHTVAAVELIPGGTALLRVSPPVSTVDGERTWTDLRLTGSGKPPRRVGKVRLVDLPAR